MYTKYEANFLDTYKKFILIVNDEYENITEQMRSYLKNVRDKFEETVDAIVCHTLDYSNSSQNVVLTRELMMIGSPILNSVERTPKNYKSTIDFKVLNSIQDLLTESIKNSLSESIKDTAVEII